MILNCIWRTKRHRFLQCERPSIAGVTRTLTANKLRGRKFRDTKHIWSLSRKDEYVKLCTEYYSTNWFQLLMFASCHLLGCWNWKFTVCLTCCPELKKSFPEFELFRMFTGSWEPRQKRPVILTFCRPSAILSECINASRSNSATGIDQHHSVTIYTVYTHTSRLYTDNWFIKAHFLHTQLHHCMHHILTVSIVCSFHHSTSPISWTAKPKSMSFKSSPSTPCSHTLVMLILMNILSRWFTSTRHHRRTHCLENWHNNEMVKWTRPVKRKFSGFKSRCSIPLWWQCRVARNICSIRLATFEVTGIEQRGCCGCFRTILKWHLICVPGVDVNWSMHGTHAWYLMKWSSKKRSSSCCGQWHPMKTTMWHWLLGTAGWRYTFLPSA